MDSPTNRNRFASILADGFLVIYFVFALFPLVWMLLFSLKSGTELFTTQFIFHPTLENYYAILFGDPRAAAGVVARQEFPRYFLNSVIVSTGAVILSLLVGVPAAYALARAGDLQQGVVIPISQTLASVNPDEFLGGLDVETRDYVQLLVGVAGQHVVVEGVEAGVRPEALGIVQAPAVDRLVALPFSHDH